MLSLIVVVVFVIVMLVSSVLFVRLIFDMDLSIGDETGQFLGKSAYTLSIISLSGKKECLLKN